jgi:NAD-specific glutamate dehydrogenase
VVHNTVVEIFTSQVRVTCSRQDLEDTIFYGQQRHVESSTTKVVDDDLALFTRLVEAVCDGCRRWLVDNTSDVETSDDAGVFGRLSLCVVEAVRASVSVKQTISWGEGTLVTY